MRVAPTLVVAALCLYRPSSIGRMEWRVYDTMVRAAGTHPPDGRVILVDVDERSLTAVGQWPWRRDLIGRLIGNLRDLGASTVALDMVFAESDRHGEGTISPDVALAETLRAGRVVLGYALTFDAGGPSRECVHHPLGVAVIQDGDEHADDPFFRAAAAVCNIPNLAQAATASGFLNAGPDPDGILRRVPLVMELGGRIYPSLALAAVSAATGTRGVALRVANVNTSTLLISSDAATGSAEADLRPLRGEMDVPLDGKSNLLLRYRGVKRTFPYVSAVDVLNRQVDPETFKDKIVFVGTSALGTREVVSTPLDTLFTGVEVQATVADNLLQRDFLHRPANASHSRGSCRRRSRPGRRAPYGGVRPYIGGGRCFRLPRHRLDCRHRIAVAERHIPLAGVPDHERFLCPHVDDRWPSRDRAHPRRSS